MAKFTTINDRKFKATGEDSNINPEDLNAEQAEELYNYITTGVGCFGTNKNIENTIDNKCIPYSIRVFGKVVPLNIALQTTTIALQLIAVIILICIAAKLAHK